MLLTTVDESQVPEEAKYLLQKTQSEASEGASSVTTELLITYIFGYKSCSLK